MGSVVISGYNNDIYQYTDSRFNSLQDIGLSVDLYDNRIGEILYLSQKVLGKIENRIPHLIAQFSDNEDCVFIDDLDTFFLSNNRIKVYLPNDQKNCKIINQSSSDSYKGCYVIRGKTYIFNKGGHIEPCAEITYEQISNLEITSTERYDNTRILIGTKKQGIWMFRNDQYKQFYIPGVSFPKKIKSLNYRQAKLWIHTLDSLLYVFDENKQVIQTVDEGVIDYDIDQWDCVYINKGDYIDVNVNYINDRLPSVEILSVRSGYNLIDHTTNHNFSDTDNNLSVKLKSNYPPAPQAVQYEYRTDKKSDWKSLQSDQLYLTDIPPGNYHLEVRGTVDDKYYTSLVGFQYSIESDWRDTIWLIVFGILSLLLILLFFSMRKLQKDKNRILSDKQRMNLEMKNIKSEQKLGQAQMNPHFMFNALNSISGLIAMDQNKSARKALNDLSQMMRMTLDNSSQESIHIEEEIRFLEKYLSVEKAIRSDSFSYNIESEIMDIRIPPMIIQPFVENAIIHGVSSLQDRKGHVSISLNEDKSYISITIKDNGVGRSAKKKSHSNTHQSAAVGIVTKRLEILDKWGSVEDYVVYEDLYDENAQPAGTKVSLLIPKRRL